MNTASYLCLWKTCEYVCVKALDNLLTNIVSSGVSVICPHFVHQFSTAYPQGAVTTKPLHGKILEHLSLFSTATTTTTLYLSKLIYIEEE